MPLTVIMPLTRTTAGELDWMALISADEVDTVTGDALPPPVVPAPNPVGLPTAAAWPADQMVIAETATTVIAPASVRRGIDLRITFLPFCRGSSLIPGWHVTEKYMDNRGQHVEYCA
jgi:hypothetical protein